LLLASLKPQRHPTSSLFPNGNIESFHICIPSLLPRFGQGRQRARKRGKGPPGMQQLQWQAVSDLAVVARAAMENRVGEP